MLPMSASLTEAHTWRRLRSLAMRNKLGALRLDTTVWPMFTRRSTMTPLTGERMVQYPRLISALASMAFESARAAWVFATLALASLRLALLWRMVASPTAREALLVRRAASAVS